MITLDAVTPRRAGEPVPDLTDYYVVHRAMTVDPHRLASATEHIGRWPGRLSAARAAALRRYLAGVVAEIRSHHEVEDDTVWPMIVAAAGPHAEQLDPLTEEHHQLDGLLDAADELAGWLAGAPGDRVAAVRLSAVLHEFAALLDRHVEVEERDVFPLITGHVRVEDYARMQRQFRRNLAPRALSFVVPWVIRHATAEERARLLADAGWPLRLLLRLFRRRFSAQERLVFG